MYLCIDTHEGFSHMEATAKFCIDTPGVSIDTHQQVSIHTHLYRYIWGFHAKLSYCQALYRYSGTQYRYMAICIDTYVHCINTFESYVHSIDTHVLGIDTCIENSFCNDSNISQWFALALLRIFFFNLKLSTRSNINLT